MAHPAVRVRAMGRCEAIRWRLPVQLYDAQGQIPLTGLALRVSCSSVVYIQLTLEDSGSQRAKSLGFSVNDDTCEVNVD